MMSDPNLEANVQDEERSRWTLFRRVKVWLGSELGYWIIRWIGATLRIEVQGEENHHALVQGNERIIYAFWHGRIPAATYFWRNRGIVVMTSQNRDGDYIARMIRRFGYGAARGSSSRGGRRALVEMIRELRRGRDAAFTLDGPRGPRYVAKPGAVWLAAKTGAAILPFHCSARRSWVSKSWDLFQVPRPFARVLVLVAPPMRIPADASEQETEQAQERLQCVMEELLRRGDSYWNV